MLAHYSKVGILETGRFNGGSTLISALANNKVKIHSIDFDPQDDDFLINLLDQMKIGKNLNIITGDSQKTKYDSINEIDLLFVDADHSKEGCLNDMVNWWDNLVKGGHMIMHDCYFGCEVQDAVLEFISKYDVEIIVISLPIFNKFTEFIFIFFKFKLKFDFIPKSHLCSKNITGFLSRKDEYKS